MMKWIIGTAVIFIALIIFGLGVFLAPDDLRGCSNGPNANDCQAADAIVAVSGGDTTARTDEAIRLYKQNWAPLIIFSGAAQDTSGPSNAQAMRAHALDQGVPDSAILVEEFSRNTAENAANAAQVIAEHDLKRIILVTSAYHQRRASLEFSAKLGPTVTIVNHPVAQDRQWSSLWWTTPGGWWLAIGEIVKIIAYFIGGKDTIL
jgi:uncharacterized SAM-binding protein YcdF (DUF218 family)